MHKFRTKISIFISTINLTNRLAIIVILIEITQNLTSTLILDEIMGFTKRTNIISNCYSFYYFNKTLIGLAPSLSDTTSQI